MKKFCRLGLCMISLLSWSLLYAQSDGEKLFKQICFACHTINQGKLIGPDLANVHQRRSETWLINFIRSSQSVIKSGDPEAAALFQEYNQMVMPDNDYSDDQIRSILVYIASNSPGGPGAAETGGISPVPGRPLSQAGADDVLSGRRLFMGEERLANGGPTCNSCHHVKNDALMGGGALARDLTEAFSRLNEAGLKAILGSPPFPAMTQAYQNHPLTEEEVFDLSAFLRQADRDKDSQKNKSYGLRLFVAGFGGALVLLFIFSGVWIKSKRISVNQSIYDRQIKSI